jgi:hypothetical protein
VKTGVSYMLTRTAFGLALVLATASGSFAATKPHATPVSTEQNINNPSGAYLATDPDPNVRLNLRRDWSHGRY